MFCNRMFLGSNDVNDGSRTLSQRLNISSLVKARFKRRILHAPNAIQTMHNEEAYLIIYCLNCIRCMQNSTFETGLSHARVCCFCLLQSVVTF